MSRIEESGTIEREARGKERGQTAGEVSERGRRRASTV